MGRNANKILFKIKYIKGINNARVDTLNRKTEL